MSNESNANPHSAAGKSAGGQDHAPEQNPLSPHKVLVVLLFGLAVAVVLADPWKFWRGCTPTARWRKVPTQQAAPTVTVAPAQPGAPVDHICAARQRDCIYRCADLRAHRRLPVHWYFDIGAKVKKGALLAVIDTPELDKQVAQAEADLATAETNAGNAKVQANRYSGLVKSDAVSQIDTDTFTTQAASTASAVLSAQANVQRLKEMQSFEKVYAPFDGVVTARNVDTGQLINQGAGSGAGTELFHMQAIETLRVYTDVPQLYTQTLKRGMKIGLTFPEHPGKTF